MNSRTYTGGLLGRSVGDALSESTLVKSSGRVSLFETESPSGTNYVVVLDYGEVDATFIFPTPNNPSKSGNTVVTKSASEAFAQFDEMVATYGGISTDSSGIAGVGSFEELDTLMLSLPELPEDVVVELQRSGTADTGRPKHVLDLKFRSGFLPSIVGRPKKGLRMARLYYESYPLEMRITALKDIRPSVLQNYMSGELLSSVIMTNREKRSMYQNALRSGRFQEVPMPQVLDNLQTVDAEPSAVIAVKFIDQHGKVIDGLPYEIACRGPINFVEAAAKTNFGAEPGNFSSGRTLIESGMSGLAHDSSQAISGALITNWKGRSLSPELFYHPLYKYRSSGGEGMPPGAMKISITTPRNVNSMDDWGNDRLFIYSNPTDITEKREGEPVKASPKTLLFSHNYRFEKGASPERITITIPVFIEPLPMHLVEMPPGSGRIVSLWSVTEDIGAIPSHQKINMEFKVLRPKASDSWEQADKILPDTRDGYDDKILQYEEFTSPEGRKAYRDGISDATPVEGVKFALIPHQNNSWIASKNIVILSPDYNGIMNAEITPGTYKLKMLKQINADGTSALKFMSDPNDPEYNLAIRYDQLSPTMQSSVSQKYPEMQVSRGSMFAPETVEIGSIEAPAGFFYRKITEQDTTPVGVVGARISRSGSLDDLNSSRLRKFRLQQQIPPLLSGKEPEAGSIYDLMGIDFPAIDGGWPGESDETDDRFFDTVTIFLAQDSIVDLSMLQSFEQRYEAERDSGSNMTSRLIAPKIGESIEFGGYIIEHLMFDTAVGPDLLNRSAAFTGGLHEYNMGKITTPFFDVGVIRCMVFYPKSGVMRRKMVVSENQNINPDVLVAAIYSSGSWDPNASAIKRVYHFEMKSSPEAAILSGRWVPLETIGEYAMGITSENTAFERIIDSIKRGGMPIRESPKWSQFWSTTADAWIFGAPGMPISGGGGSDTVVVPPAGGGGIIVGDGADGGIVTVAGQQVETHTVTPLWGTLGKMENELGESMDILAAPNPDYGDLDDDMGFVEG